MHVTAGPRNRSGQVIAAGRRLSFTARITPLTSMVAVTPNDSQENATPPRTWREFSWYVGGHGFYFASQGIQAVMFPYLVTFLLRMPADMVGVGQMFAMLPMFGLVLFGGMSADRSELRMHLIRLQFLASLPMILLSIFLFTDTLTFVWLVACVSAVGCAGAFIMPARDSLLSRVATRTPHGDIQRAVTMSTAAQFGSQFIGMWVGIICLSFNVPLTVIMLIAVSFYMVSAYCGTYVSPAPPEVMARDPDPYNRTGSFVGRMFEQIHEGLREVWRSPRMFPVILMMFCGGILFMGVFTVHLQLLVRDVYGGDVRDYMFISMWFMVGISVSALVLSQVLHIRRQGRAMMLSFTGGTIVMVILHFHPPIQAVYGLALFWGLTSGISMSMSRSIVQEAATDSHRARIMSIYTLGFLGGGPLGALLMGYTTKHLGALDAVLVPAAGMVIVWICMFVFTDLWKLTRPDPVSKTYEI